MIKSSVSICLRLMLWVFQLRHTGLTRGHQPHFTVEVSVLGFIFGSMIHFELIFVYGSKFVLYIYMYIYIYIYTHTHTHTHRYSVILAPFLKRLLLLHRSIFAPLSEISCLFCMGLFLESLYCSNAFFLSSPQHYPAL